jgi:hypothetical protein
LISKDDNFPRRLVAIDRQELVKASKCDPSRAEAQPQFLVKSYCVTIIHEAECVEDLPTNEHGRLNYSHPQRLI